MYSYSIQIIHSNNISIWENKCRFNSREWIIINHISSKNVECLGWLKKMNVILHSVVLNVTVEVSQKVIETYK